MVIWGFKKERIYIYKSYRRKCAGCLYRWQTFSFRLPGAIERNDPLLFQTNHFTLFFLFLVVITTIMNSVTIRRLTYGGMFHLNSFSNLVPYCSSSSSWASTTGVFILSLILSSSFYLFEIPYGHQVARLADDTFA